MNERNIVLENFEKIDGLKNDVYNYLLNIINSPTPNFMQSDNIIAKLIENNKNRYLIVNRDDSLTVYSEPRLKEMKPFQYGDIEKGQIYYSKIFSFPNEEFIKNEFNSMYEGMKEELRNELIKIRQKSSSRNNQFNMTGSTYGLIEFFEAIGQPPVLKKFLEENSWSNLMKDNENLLDVERVKSNINRMFDAAEKNKFNKKNKYDYNDLDNRIWIQDKKLCFSSQNMGYVVNADGENISVYIYPEDKDILKEQININNLISKINNNQINDIKNTVLKIEGEKVLFVDPYIISSMTSELDYGIMNLEDDDLIDKAMLSSEKLLSPDEFVINRIKDYPTLYLKYSFNVSKLAILDHVFNTIGSGSDDFTRLVIGKPTNFGEIENWFGEKDVFEIEKNGVRKIVMEDPKDEGYKIYKSKDNCVVPYPNFEKKYSMVYSEAFKNSDDEWKLAALEFYTYAKEFFQDKDKRQAYHYCFEIDNYNPDSENGTSFLLTKNNVSNNMRSLVHDMKKRFENMSIEQISKDYEVEFIGDKTNDTDIMKFLQNRWFKEKERIESFLDETISMIENDLNKTKKLKP